ncbi:hypothetical protein FGO68_gene1934 [Halteria grandinella]|uniref:Uncharacterized protein n=1 Tax=Halteria grandinella TaxID=5974 RepID=A0A8J8SZF7_HALGN|nr:hypothetical protein FGO68_gene1934 [Halteria grandinella]
MNKSDYNNIMLKNILFRCRVHNFSRSTLYTKNHDFIRIGFWNQKNITIGKTPAYFAMKNLIKFKLNVKEGTYDQGECFYKICSKKFTHKIKAPLPLTVTEGIRAKIDVYHYIYLSRFIEIYLIELHANYPEMGLIHAKIEDPTSLHEFMTLSQYSHYVKSLGIQNEVIQMHERFHRYNRFINVFVFLFFYSCFLSIAKYMCGGTDVFKWKHLGYGYFLTPFIAMHSIPSAYVYLSLWAFFDDPVMCKKQL